MFHSVGDDDGDDGDDDDGDDDRMMMTMTMTMTMTTMMMTMKITAMMMMMITAMMVMMMMMMVVVMVTMMLMMVMVMVMTMTITTTTTMMMMITAMMVMMMMMMMMMKSTFWDRNIDKIVQGIVFGEFCRARECLLRWLPPVLHFPESLNFTKGFLTHHDGLVPVVARWCYNSFYLLNSCAPNINFVSMATIQRSKYTLY